MTDRAAALQQRGRASTPSVRYAAVHVVLNLLNNRASLATALPQWSATVAPKDRPLLMELSYGVARWSIRLSALMKQLMDKPLRQKDQDVAALIQIGLYQLIHTRIPPHAAINTTVEVTRELNKKWAKGLVNAVLRNYQRKHDSLVSGLSPYEAMAFPQWLAERFKQHWPQEANAIMALSNEHPPMMLRVNCAKQNCESYLHLLGEHDIDAKKASLGDNAIVLDNAVAVAALPLFEQGHVSVQDGAAQLAAEILNPKDNERILDACAAPGGKTGHLLELAPNAKVVAIDIDAVRLQRVHENANRLCVQERLQTICADAANLDSWWNGQQFDAVLLDAPCSGTGVLRRHPDIKLLRRESDLTSIMETQQRLLHSMWRVLKPGGRMLYATCSQLKEENEQQVQNFIRAVPDAKDIALDSNWGREQMLGRQLLLTHSEADGFYYCLLRKSQ